MIEDRIDAHLKQWEEGEKDWSLKLGEKIKGIANHIIVGRLLDDKTIRMLYPIADEVAQLEAENEELLAKLDEMIAWHEGDDSPRARLEARVEKLILGLSRYAEYDRYGKPINYAAEVLEAGDDDEAL